MLDSTCLFHKIAGYNKHLLRMHDVQQITVHLLQLIISVRDIEVPAGGSLVSSTESRISSGKSPVLRSAQGCRSHTRQGLSTPSTYAHT